MSVCLNCLLNYLFVCLFFLIKNKKIKNKNINKGKNKKGNLCSSSVLTSLCFNNVRVMENEISIPFF
jgi:hypothetical protein